MELRLSVYELGPYDNGSMSSFTRNVDWPSMPDKEEIIFVADSINATVTMRVFSTEGASIEAQIVYCRDEYADICRSVLEDGFTKVREDNRSNHA